MMTVEPWKGGQWGNHDNFFKGKKLLILGESAYYENEVGNSPRDMITGAVDAYFRRDTAHYGKFQPKITTLLAGKAAHWQVSEGEKEKIWDSIMLWNYVPFAVAEYSRQRPTAEMFRNSRKSFDEFMERYDPEAVLVCGYCTWGWLMNDRPEYPGSSWDTPSSPLYQIDNATFARMRHPSGRGFNYTEARAILDALLSRAN